MNKEQLVEKVVKEWSYRCEKGYPDLNNEKDLEVFKEMFGVELKEKYEFDYLDDDTKQLAQTIASKLKGLGIDLDKSNLQAHKKSRILIRAPEGVGRDEIIKAIEEFSEDLQLKFVRPIPGSSRGGYKHTETGQEIIFKDSTTQRMGLAGKQNEETFFQKINETLEEKGTVDVEIIPQDKGTVLKYKNVNEVKDVSRGSVGEKADARLISTAGKVHSISIKKDGPFRWSSIMGSHKKLLKNFLEKAKKGEIADLELIDDTVNPYVLNMVNPNNRKNYGKVFIKNMPGISIEDMAFGTDNVDIVQRTFNERDFKLTGNTLQVKVSRTYKTVEDFEPEDNPVVVLERNASKALKAKGVLSRGITIRTVPVSAMSTTERANILIVDYNEIFNSR